MADELKTKKAEMETCYTKLLQSQMDSLDTDTSSRTDIVCIHMMYIDICNNLVSEPHMVNEFAFPGSKSQP